MAFTKQKTCSRLLGAIAFMALSTTTAAQESDTGDFTMLIMDVFTITGRGAVLTGQVKSGAFEVGDTVCIPLTNGATAASTVEGIEMHRQLLDRAEEGQLVAVIVQVDKKLVEKGALLHGDCELAEELEELEELDELDELEESGED